MEIYSIRFGILNQKQEQMFLIKIIETAATQNILNISTTCCHAQNKKWINKKEW